MAKASKKTDVTDTERAYWRGISAKMKTLKQCGIRRRPGITLRNVVSAARLCDDPRRPRLTYLKLVEALGYATERALKPLSDDVFWQDMGCFYAPRHYRCLAQQLRTLAHPYLPLKDIRVAFEDNAYVGHLCFRLDDRKYAWRFRAYKRWLDGSVCTRFARLLASRKSPKRFTYYGPGVDGYFLIGCATPEQVRLMKAKTRVWWAWLEDVQIS